MSQIASASDRAFWTGKARAEPRVRVRFREMVVTYPTAVWRAALRAESRDSVSVSLRLQAWAQGNAE